MTVTSKPKVIVQRERPLPVRQETPSSELAGRRREQIVEAAMTIIAKEGIDRLSLGRIQKAVGMARGHLTYFFPTKEAILLAVVDRMMAEHRKRIEADRQCPKPGQASPRQVARFMLTHPMSDSPAGRDFLSVMATFSAQMNHRDDYRAKVAGMQAEWRDQLAAKFSTGVSEPPEIAASFLMALAMGLNNQLAADPAAFDRTRMAAVCDRLIAPLFPSDHSEPDGDA
ncbi:MAG TPA: TetR/AcrR family transcriptional regulator [Fimbriiglobus sp.]|jgi:AcrR family transcriptional regulator